MNNTILSIDLDIIFSPYIGIYNNYVLNNIPNKDIWEKIQELYYINDFELNKKYNNLILEIIKEYQNKVKTIYIGEDHSSILQAIQNEKLNFNTPYKFDLYNIDYHHDIFYSEDQGKRISQYELCDCGSWVGYLSYFNYLNEYYWFCGQGSNLEQKLLLDSEPQAVPKTYKILFNEFPMDLNIDLMFISLSFPWMPLNKNDEINNILNTIDKTKIKFLKYPFFYNNQKQNFLNNKCEQYYNNFAWLYNSNYND